MPKKRRRWKFALITRFDALPDKWQSYVGVDFVKKTGSIVRQYETWRNRQEAISALEVETALASYGANAVRK
jgi:hypothetical protein